MFEDSGENNRESSVDQLTSAFISFKNNLKMQHQYVIKPESFNPNK